MLWCKGLYDKVRIYIGKNNFADNNVYFKETGVIDMNIIRKKGDINKEKNSKMTKAVTIEKLKESRINKKIKKVNTEKKSKKSVKKRKGKKIRIFNFSRKLLAMCILPMIFACIIVTAISTRTLKGTMEGEIKKSMKIAAASIVETYTNLYKGDYAMDIGGQVTKGDTKISGNSELVDAIGEKTGFDVSMMFGNMRLLTTVKNSAGHKVTGTGTEQKVYDKVSKGKEVFLKDFNVGEKVCYVFYEPLINSDGSTFGAVEISQEVTSLNKTIQNQSHQLMIFSVMVVVVVCIIVIFTSRKTVRKMMHTKSFLDKIIDGRLDAVPHAKTFKANDELGDIYRSSVKLQHTFNDMVSGIKELSEMLRGSADELSGMAQTSTDDIQNVENVVQKISDGARNQADSTANAKDDINTINVQIEQIVGEVDIMAENAEEMSDKEHESERIINELTNSSDDTKVSIAKATEQINLMSDAVKKIRNAVELIQAIADETDLLSINANIEAARAGEAGKGFAVVADQINKLAVQSNNSSQDIQVILNDIAEISDKTVQVMNEVRENMDVQQEKLEETRETHKAVSDKVEQSRKNMGNIKDKIVVLNTSGTSISDSVDSLACVSEENATLAYDTINSVKEVNETMQNVQASSEELLKMAEELHKIMGSFQL